MPSGQRGVQRERKASFKETKEKRAGFLKQLFERRKLKKNRFHQQLFNVHFVGKMLLVKMFDLYRFV
jgi:hypothetical protein